ncbi:MAG TPA: hypothetical protein VE931_02890 [Pyrinomonadaceae bacterium]|nr:hypothetical protein [Pyrinomonadaceae bacterium]
MDKRRLEEIERYIINFIQEQQQSRILAKDLFDSTTAYANADIVRALEDLEKRERLLVRHTTEGNDFISLTSLGVARLGLEKTDIENEAGTLPHPPKSATKAI